MGIRAFRIFRRFSVLSLVSLFAMQAASAFAAEPVVAPEVVVTATRVETPAEQIGSAITVITAEDIAERHPAFVEELLRYVPGVDVGTTGGAAGGLTQVRIRGSEGNHTLVIIDGVEVNRPNVSNEFDFFALKPEDIERIEVLRGPQTALYGSEAVGGVINIITKEGRGKPRVSLTQEFGSNFTRNTHLAASAGGKLGKGFTYNARLSGTTFHTDGISAASLGTENDPFDMADGNGKFGISYKKTVHLDLVGRFTRSDLKNDSSEGAIVGIGALDNENSTNTKDRYGRAQVRLDLFEGRWKQKFGVMGTENVIQNKNGSGKVTFRNEGKKTVWDYQSAFNVETKALVPADHTLIIGYDNEDDRQRSSSVSEVNNNDIYFNYQLGLAKRFFFTGGAQWQRSDFFPNVDIEDSYRFTAAYLHRETGTKIKGAFGRGVKNPTLFELFGSTDNFVGNPNLQPEQAKSWEAGFEQSFLGKKLKVDAVYFDNQIINLISGSGTSAKNIAGASIHGVELTVKASPLDNLDLIANYTWMTTEQKSGADVGSTLVRRPKHKMNLDTIYRFLNDKAKVGASFLYNSAAQDYDFDNSGGFSFATRRLTTLDGYFLVNIYGSYDVRDGVRLFARVDNLLNETYEEVYGFSRPGLSGFAGIKLTY